MSEITIDRTETSRIHDVDFDNIPFGRIFSDHMVEVDYIDDQWTNAKIRPFGNLSVSPALSCLHYGQAIFEGMKAIRNEDGQVHLFRPQDNWHRLNLSAERMKMPSLPENLFMDALQQWLNIDKDWIPGAIGSALYIRPVMFATDDYLGVKASEKYKFLIYGCPVAGYYSEPLRVRIEEKYVRAAVGGVGEAKAAGNYAASMFPASEAQNEGFHQLLWTDAVEHKFIEELGTSNFFAVVDGDLYTPQLDGTILQGITRDSIIQLSRHLGLSVHESKISTDFLLQSFEKGILTEAFATGTAATIAPIELIQYRDTSITLNVKDNPITSKLHQHLDEIKRGKRLDFAKWNVQVDVKSQS